MYARLAATARELDHVVALRHAVVDAAPYADAAEFSADLDVLAALAEASNGSAIVARGRLRASAARRRRVRLSSRQLDLRQNSDVHERTIAELLAAATPGHRLYRL